jgi:hypothetical protein
MPYAKYEVLVGNIGMVWSEETLQSEESRAVHEFNDWVARSQREFGRASGEAVTLFKDGEILKEYTPNGPV